MALMKYREGNEIKFVGVRPGHRGTQIAKSNTKSNGGQIIHTVTAGQVLCLTYCNLTAFATGAGSGYFRVRDDEDALQYTIIWVAFPVANKIFSLPVVLNPPLEIPAGYDIYVESQNAGITVYGFMHGWEEKA